MRRSMQKAAKGLAVGYDVVRPPRDGVVILAYHRVGGGSGLELDVDPEVFLSHMEWLAENRSVIGLDAAVAVLSQADGVADPGLPVTVITFDDGTADFIDHALPALVETATPATYYIATDFIESRRSFPDNGTPLSWNGLAEALSTGLVTIGSHTHTHAVMDKLTWEEADLEARRSIELIEDRLGQPVQHFAYPKGVWGGPAIDNAVRHHFRSAAVANCGVNRHLDTDVFQLDRTPIQRSDGPSYFRSKASGGMRLEGRMRTLANRRRYSSAVH